MVKELFGFTDNESDNSDYMTQVIKQLVKEDPDIVYEQINEDEDPNFRKQIVSSQAATAHPCFVALNDGKVTGIVAGEASADQIKSLFN